MIFRVSCATVTRKVKVWLTCKQSHLLTYKKVTRTLSPIPFARSILLCFEYVKRTIFISKVAHELTDNPTSVNLTLTLDLILSKMNVHPAPGGIRLVRLGPVPAWSQTVPGKPSLVPQDRNKQQNPGFSSNIWREILEIKKALCKKAFPFESLILLFNCKFSAKCSFTQIHLHFLLDIDPKQD